MYSAKNVPTDERWIFFKRWLKNPKRLGTCAPISKSLARQAAACIKNPENVRLVEIGSGPGTLTHFLLDIGIQPEKVKAVELDPELCAFARKTIPHVEFIEGDARYLSSLLPSDWVGQVDIVFSTIPLAYLPSSLRRDIVSAALAVLKPGGDFFHLTYSLWSPLRTFSHIFQSKKVVSVWRNIPPAFIWRYSAHSPMISSTVQQN